MNNSPPTYVLDTSVFIEAYRRYYGFDIAPGFWNALLQHAGNATVLSIDRVKKEIGQGQDELATWANNDFHSVFKSTNDNAVLSAYQRVIQWAMAQSQYTDAAKAESQMQTTPMRGSWRMPLLRAAW